jgi:hypothetical protein
MPEVLGARVRRADQLVEAGDQGSPVLVRAEEVVQDGVLVAVGDRVEPEHRSLRPGVELGEPYLQRVVGTRLVAPHRDLAADGLVSFGPGGVGAVADPAQPDVVGVGVEDDDPQGGLGEHLLEQQAQRVRLARP